MAFLLPLKTQHECQSHICSRWCAVALVQFTQLDKILTVQMTLMHDLDYVT